MYPELLTMMPLKREYRLKTNNIGRQSCCTFISISIEQRVDFTNVYQSTIRKTRFPIVQHTNTQTARDYHACSDAKCQSTLDATSSCHSLQLGCACCKEHIAINTHTHKYLHTQEMPLQIVCVSPLLCTHVCVPHATESLAVNASKCNVR